MKASIYRSRVFGMFQKHPKASYTVAELERELKDVQRATIGYWLKEFIKDGTVVKPKYGHYQLNDTPPDLDAIRAEALRLGKARIIDTGRTWKAGEDALLPHAEHPALPSRRLHFLSILERMRANAAFSQYDVELLKDVAPQLVREKEAAGTA